MFWRMIDISILNSWIIFRSNLPESEISSHRLFWIHLVHELVQPLLMLKASPDCPVPSVSEPHIDELTAEFVYIYMYIICYILYYI